jgi:hypothetical protein
MESLKIAGVPVDHYDSIARACVTHLVRVCNVQKHDLYDTLLETPERTNPISFQLKVFSFSNIHAMLSINMYFLSGHGQEMG